MKYEEPPKKRHKAKFSHHYKKKDDLEKSILSALKDFRMIYVSDN